MGVNGFLKGKIYIDMIRHETYEWISDEFGVSIGIAKILGYKKLRDDKEELTPKMYKSHSDDLVVNGIISDSIEEGKYQPLQREIYRLRGKSSRIKDVTLYKRAWKEINGNK